MGLDFLLLSCRVAWLRVVRRGTASLCPHHTMYLCPWLWELAALQKQPLPGEEVCRMHLWHPGGISGFVVPNKEGFRLN